MVGDAEELPFDDDQFDIYTIAFGIRNVTHIDQVTGPDHYKMNAQMFPLGLLVLQLGSQPVIGTAGLTFLSYFANTSIVNILLVCSIWCVCQDEMKICMQEKQSF